MATKIRRRDQNAPQVKFKTRLKKDDTVKVIAGRDKGKTGRVLDLDRERGRVLVEGVGLVKRHTRPNPSKQIKGGIAERESSIAISNVMLVTSGGVATRVGYRVEGTGATARRVRVAIAREPPRLIDTELDVVLGPGLTFAAGAERVSFQGPRTSTLEERATIFELEGPPPPPRARLPFVVGGVVLALLLTGLALRRRAAR